MGYWTGSASAAALHKPTAAEVMRAASLMGAMMCTASVIGAVTPADAPLRAVMRAAVPIGAVMHAAAVSVYRLLEQAADTSSYEAATSVCVLQDVWSLRSAETVLWLDVFQPDIYD